MHLGGALDDAEAFVLGAVRSFATGATCPAPPADDRWVEVAQRAGVLPVVLDTVREAGGALPASAGLSRYSGVATRLRAVAELTAVLRALEPTTVRWVVVKGPVLAEAVYRRGSVRSYTDLDVLVHPDDLGEALAALEAAGFGLVDRNWRLVADTGRGEINLTIPGGGLLDLHWHVVNDRRTRDQFRLDVRSMVENRVTVRIDRLCVPSLDPADMIVHLALHAGLSGGYNAQWLLDLQQAVLRGGCTPTQLGERAVAMAVGPMVQAMLLRAAEYVDVRLGAWASGSGPSTAWNRLCRLVSRFAPPLGSRSGRHTGRLVFSSTRATTARSARAAVRLAVDEWLPFGRSMTLGSLHAAEGTVQDRNRWIAGARTSR